MIIGEVGEGGRGGANEAAVLIVKLQAPKWWGLTIRPNGGQPHEMKFSNVY